MNRRMFLQSAAASVAAAAVTGCRHARPADILPGTAASLAGCGLPPVRISAEREVRTVAGLRPYRPSGFVVHADRIEDRLVIHNYGHGGGGVTLSWGTARLAVDRIPPDERGPVGVLGCGAVGLATSRLIQESGRAVTIYAKDLPPNTTSDIAGAQWFPFLVSEHTYRTGEFLQQFTAACEFAHARFQSLVTAQTRCGVSIDTPLESQVSCVSVLGLRARRRAQAARMVRAGCELTCREEDLSG